MGRRKSIVRQGIEKLLAMAAYGQSKHEGKKMNGGFPAREKIYSSVTMDNYGDFMSRFLRWTRRSHGCQYIEEAEEHVREYLEQRIQAQSPWTVRAECAGISTLYQKSMDAWGVDLPSASATISYSIAKTSGSVTFPLNEMRTRSPSVWQQDCAAARSKQQFPMISMKKMDRFRAMGKGGKFRIVRCLNRDPLDVVACNYLYEKIQHNSSTEVFLFC